VHVGRARPIKSKGPFQPTSEGIFPPELDPNPHVSSTKHGSIWVEPRCQISWSNPQIKPNITHDWAFIRSSRPSRYTVSHHTISMFVQAHARAISSSSLPVVVRGRRIQTYSLCLCISVAMGCVSIKFFLNLTEFIENISSICIFKQVY